MLFDERRRARDLFQHIRLRRRKGRRAHGREVVVVDRPPETVGVRRHVVGERRVHRARPGILARNAETVHADDRTRRVRTADRLVHVPQPRLGVEAVLALPENAQKKHSSFVLLAGGDRLLRLEAGDHARDVAPLPHERIGVAERIAVRKRRRDVVAEGHLPRQERHDEADAVLLGDVAEFLEVLDHPLVHARTAARRIGKRLLGVEHPRLVHLVEIPARKVAGVDRLEVRPIREDAQDPETVRGEHAQVLVDGLRIPLPPHLRRGMARPVVRAQHNPSGRQKGILRRRPRRTARSTRRTRFGHCERHHGQSHRQQQFPHFIFLCPLLFNLNT